MHITGTQGGHSVEIEGSFDNWQHRHALQRSGNDFTLVKLLTPGTYQVGVTEACYVYFSVQAQRKHNLARMFTQAKDTCQGQVCIVNLYRHQCR